jgi:drug/metabolite transporter (DMT)-like permease
MENNMTLSRAEKLDKIFGTPVFAVLLAIFCNALWGCAFPFIKMGYRLFEIDPSNTASIFCFAGVRFMLGSLLVLLGSTLLQSRMPTFPKGKVFAECCVLGLWQTTIQYAFYYIAVAMLTGAFGGILNSTQSFLGVIFAHFIYGDADRMTPAKTLGCAVGFAGVLIGTLGNHGGVLGETCALTLLLGGLYLIATKVISPTIPVTYLATVAVLSLVSGRDPIYQLLSGGLMLGAFFMATDYVTSPTTTKGKIVFGLGLGVITCAIRFLGTMNEGVSFAILLMNLLVPYIEILTRQDRLGIAKTKKKEGTAK